MPDTDLKPAPGAQAAKVCGILAIVFALTCVGFPIAIILGIVALVQQGKAKRLVRTQPSVFEPVPATALVTGIIGLVLPVLMLPFMGIASAIAIPAFIMHREKAQEAAVQANLDAAKMQANEALQAILAKAPGKIPSQDAIIQALSANPHILSLKNPITPSAPAFQLGTSGPLGTVMVFADQDQEEGVTTWLLRFRAVVRLGEREKILTEELVTHEQGQAQEPTGVGWQDGQPGAETPEPPPVPAPQN